MRYVNTNKFHNVTKSMERCSKRETEFKRNYWDRGTHKKQIILFEEACTRPQSCFEQSQKVLYISRFWPVKSDLGTISKHQIHPRKSTVRTWKWMVSKTILSIWDVSHFQGRELLVSGIYDWPKTLALSGAEFCFPSSAVGWSPSTFGWFKPYLAASGGRCWRKARWVWEGLGLDGPMDPWKITGLEDGLGLGENIVKANMFFNDFFYICSI